MAVKPGSCPAGGSEVEGSWSEAGKGMWGSWPAGSRGSKDSTGTLPCARSISAADSCWSRKRATSRAAAVLAELAPSRAAASQALATSCTAAAVAAAAALLNKAGKMAAKRGCCDACKF